MALAGSGQLTLGEIAAEFGGSAPHALSEYYGSDTVPSSGEITIGDFHGTANAVYMVATGGSVSTSGDYKIHTFSSSGSFNVTTGGNDGGNRSVQSYILVRWWFWCFWLVVLEVAVEEQVVL